MYQVSGYNVYPDDQLLLHPLTNPLQNLLLIRIQPEVVRPLNFTRPNNNLHVFRVIIRLGRPKFSTLLDLRRALNILRLLRLRLRSANMMRRPPIHREPALNVIKYQRHRQHQSNSQQHNRNQPPAHVVQFRGGE